MKPLRPPRQLRTPPARAAEAPPRAIEARHRAPTPTPQPCACGGGCPRCTAATGAGGGHRNDGLSAVREVLARPGQALPEPARGVMQAQLGRDLGHVRIHTDAAAAASASAVAARAYTVGRHVAFAAGEYAPHSDAGRRLLAHELAHTVPAGVHDTPTTLRLGAADDPAERMADAAAGRASGFVPPAPAADAGVLRRTPAPTAPPSMGAKAAQLSACRIHFKHARAELKDVNQFDRCMKAARAYLKTADPSAAIVLYGFASDEGGVAFNQTLSEDRARTVARLFGQGGIAKSRVQWFGYGADTTYPTAEDNRRVEVVLLAQTSVPQETIQGTRPRPVPFPAVTDADEGTPDDLFDASIDSAESLGLPVKFLREVQGVYSATTTGDNSTNTVLNVIEFMPGVLTRNFDPTNAGMSPIFGTLYHEGTHAYIEDLMSDVEPFASARKIAEIYYRNSPVGDQGTITTDPSRLAAEAAGEYVDHRINTWWKAYTSLAAKASRGKLTADALDKIRDAYNEGMKKQDFGYSVEDGEELHTSTSMDASLMRVLDERVLEDKIPKSFDQVAAFAKIIAAAKAKNQLPP